MHPVELAARVHIDFVGIHPFIVSFYPFSLSGFRVISRPIHKNKAQNFAQLL
jgi:hypothetical protein